MALDPRPIGQTKKIGKDSYRGRVGGFRILYIVSDRDRTVEIVQVEKRGDAYRKKGRRRR